MEGEHHIRVKVVIEDAENPEIRKEFYINHTIKIIPPDELKPNALIESYIIEADTGEPLANVEVVFVGTNGIPSYRTDTDERGHYSIEFYAHKYSDTGLYHGYCLSVGESYRRAFFPKPGDKISHNVTLKVTEYTVKSEYRIVAKYPTGYPIWLADLDKEEKYIVLTSGHHTIPIEERDPEKHGLYFFDTNGTLLWRYPTKAQIWGLDISDDGKYVAAALMEPYGKVLLFDNKGNILWDTDELGYDEKFQPWGYGGLESREVKISHNSEYVAVGSTPGLLMLLRLSSGEILWERFLNGQIRGIVFTEDDKIMYVSSGDGYVYKMSVETGEVLGRAYVEAWTRDIA